MRESIKCRAKSTISGSWVYGYYLLNHGINQIYTGNGFIPVHPNTVCQLTGKKDNKGNDIYEGDLLEFDREEWGSDNNIFEVSWDENNSEWNWGGGCTSDMEFRTVVGNVLDNHELLK